MGFWVSMGIYGRLSVPMGFRRCLWAFIGFYGVL